MKRLWALRPATLIVFTDGAIRPEGNRSGLAAIVLDERRRIVRWLGKRAGPLTSCQAEYAAVVVALEALREWKPSRLDLYTDSQVVVHQINGLAHTRNRALQQQLLRVRSLAREYPAVTFHLVPRERNRIADALANELADGFSKDFDLSE